MGSMIADRYESARVRIAKAGDLCVEGLVVTCMYPDDYNALLPVVFRDIEATRISTSFLSIKLDCTHRDNTYRPC
jgi:hypothetical protein